VGVGFGGRNDPNIVCTYEYNKKRKKKKNNQSKIDWRHGLSGSAPALQV
jgi:hypothetical protein